jgi:mevalonate kinase
VRKNIVPNPYLFSSLGTKKGNALATGSGYGKVILFGEHFVVYGLPAIASAIADSTVADVFHSGDRKGKSGVPKPGVFVMRGEGWTLHDARPETPGYKAEKAEEQKKSIDLMLAFLKVDTKKTPLDIHLGGELKAASGVGASAASCAAIARALSDLLDLKLSDAQVNEVAHEGEKGYHGTPSGIDDTAATYGGLFLFKKAQPKNMVELIRTEKPLEIVMGNTGMTASTSEVVAGVRERKDKDPQKFERLFKEAEGLVMDSREALEAGDIPKIGGLMNLNHRLLQDIGVSNDKLETLVGIARKECAPGAKITGTGKGGYMVALTPGKELQEKVAKAMEKAGFAALRTSIGGRM